MVIDSQFTVATTDGGVEAGDQWDDLNADSGGLEEDDKTKIKRIGSDGRTYTWKKRGYHFLTGPPLPQSSMEEGTILWYGVV